MARRFASLACVVLIALFVAPRRAQSAQDPRPEFEPGVSQQSTSAPAHIAFVDGTAVLERDGRTETAPQSMPLLAGDRIRTQSGRVEVLFDDGSTLHLDANTVVDLQSDEVVRLLDGRIRLTIAGPARDVSYRVDAPSAWVQITQPGEYRVSLSRGERDAQLELAVLRGSAEIANESGRTGLRAGERAFARAGAAPSFAYVFNSAAWDAFDRWSEARRDERLGLSTQYLPDEVRPYASTFDRYGSWRYEAPYGRVWYPTVYDNWRPYYRGRWRTLRPYGWTWIGTDPWAWPTHHYGRWGFSAGAWFWIPGRSWGPAWVSWAYAPGYVSWCPLGWNNRPVVQFVNVRGNVRGGRGYDPWRAWTVVPRQHFGGGSVHARFVAGRSIDARTREAFVVRERAPEFRGYAVSRSGAPIRSAGNRLGIAGPRGGAAEAPSSRIVTSEAAGSVRSRSSVATQPDVRRQGSPDSERRGFPAPARPSRTPSAVRQAPRAGAPGDARVYSTPSASRAVPRDRRTDQGDVRSTGPSGTVPVYRGEGRVPTDRSAEPARAPIYAPPAGAVRTAPHGDDARPGGLYRPDQGEHRAPDRGGMPAAPRAMPRENAPAERQPARPATQGYERRGPSAPAASAPVRGGAQERGAAPERGGTPAGASGASRSRGGAPSSGTATRRPGGGN